jgi:hypothetical protein
VQQAIRAQFPPLLWDPLGLLVTAGVWVQLWDVYQPLPAGAGQLRALVRATSEDVARTAKLVLRLKLGDPTAADSLWHEIEPKVDSILTDMNRMDEKGAIWIRLKQAHINLAFIGKVKTRWLRKVITNASRDGYRKNRIFSNACELSEADGKIDPNADGEKRLLLAEFANAAMKAGIYPHHFLGALAFLLFPPRKIAAYGATPFRLLAADFVSRAFDSAVAEKVLAYLQSFFDLTAGTVIKDPNTRRICKTPVLKKRIGDTCFEDYANGRDLAAVLSYWKFHVVRKVRHVLKIAHTPKFKRRVQTRTSAAPAA